VPFVHAGKQGAVRGNKEADEKSEVYLFQLRPRGGFEQERLQPHAAGLTASLAKPAKDAKETLYSGFKPGESSFLCELSASLRSAYCWLREHFFAFWFDSKTWLKIQVVGL
jgi:hypothetical protein